MYNVIRQLILLFFLFVIIILPAELLMIMFVLLFFDSLIFKRSLKKVISKLKPAIYLSAMVLLLYLATADLYFGLSLALRLLLMFWLAEKLIEELPIQKMISGISRWRFLGLPFGRLSLIMLVAVTSFPIIFRESKNIYDAHVSRGMDFKKENIFKRIRCLLYFLNGFFHKIFERVDSLTLAMESRISRLA